MTVFDTFENGAKSHKACRNFQAIFYCVSDIQGLKKGFLQRNYFFPRRVNILSWFSWYFDRDLKPLWISNK